MPEFKSFDKAKRDIKDLTQELYDKLLTSDNLSWFLLKANKYKNVKIKIKNNILIWKSGVWIEGRWIGGIWKSGIWVNGIWENGTWENGIWNLGIWNLGIWKAGIWKKGIWIDGIWKDGYWYNGTWKAGTWKDGIWKDGYWYNGVWEGGVWKGGWKLIFQTPWKFYYNYIKNEIQIGCEVKTIDSWDRWFAGTDEYETPRDSEKFKKIYDSYKVTKIACELRL